MAKGRLIQFPGSGHPRELEPKPERQEARVTGDVVSGTINVVRLFLRPRVGKAVIVGDFPHLPNNPPEYFLTVVRVAAEAAAATAAGIIKKPVDIDAPRIDATMKAVFAAVAAKVKTLIAGPDGKIALRLEDGAIIRGNLSDYGVDYAHSPETPAVERPAEEGAAEPVPSEPPAQKPTQDVVEEIDVEV